ncbi:UNVERIFIED_CONTAM: hypothetical protein RMT77_007085 [Armadillidium vulgare]
MDHYRKSEKFREHLEVCMPGLEDETLSLIVTPGTQINSILPSAFESLKKNGQVLWIGFGSSCDKAVACAEAMKSRHRGLRQNTQIMTKRVEEYWEPIVEGMNTLQVVREIPAIAILLSKQKDKEQNEEKSYGERSFYDGYDP